MYAMISLAPFNLTKLITIFRVYFSYRERNFKKTDILTMETLKLCGYAIPCL